MSTPALPPQEAAARILNLLRFLFDRAIENRQEITATLDRNVVRRASQDGVLWQYRPDGGAEIHITIAPDTSLARDGWLPDHRPRALPGDGGVAAEPPFGPFGPAAPSGWSKNS